MLDPRPGPRHAASPDWRPRHVRRGPRKDWRARAAAALTVLAMLTPAAVVDASPRSGTGPPPAPARQPYRVTTEFDLRESRSPDDRPKTLPTPGPAVPVADPSPAVDADDRNERRTGRCRRHR